MTAIRMRVLLAAICLLATLHLSSQRSLQQASQGYRFVTKLYSGVGDGGLSLISNYTIVAYTNGTVVSGEVNTTSPGYALVLSPGDVLLSDNFRRAGCFQVALNPTLPGVGGFISRYSDLIGSTTSSGYFSFNNAVILAGSNVTTGDTSVHSATANPNEKYTFLAYNLGNFIGLAKVQLTAQSASGCTQALAPSPAAMQTPFAALGPASGATANNNGGATGPAADSDTLSTISAQNTSSSTASSPATGSGRRLRQLGGGMSGLFNAPAQGPGLVQQSQTEGRNAPALGPSSPQTDSVQITRRSLLTDSDYLWLAGFTNMSCLAYTLIGQQQNILGLLPSRIDLSVFLLDEANTKNWFSQGLDIAPDNIDFQAITLQNNANNGNQFTYLDGLDPSTRYFLFVIAGMQNVSVISSDVILDIAYTGQATGSCSNNLVSQYIGDSSSSTATAPSALTPVGSTTGASTSASPSTSQNAASPTISNSQAASPPQGLQLQSTGQTNTGNGLFTLPGKKL